MKKTISLTLGGRVFLVEEDGYAALDAYLRSLRAYYAAEPSVDELLADIEASLGEKLGERLSPAKQAVALDDVEQVIGLLGRVEDITGETAGTANSSAVDSKKRLYRDPEQTVIAGVCGGLAAYFGTDPVFIRIAFLLLALVNGLGILAYAILWIAVPRAETSLQRLEMLGKPAKLNAFQELLQGRPAGTTANRWRSLANVPVAAVGGIYEALKRILLGVGEVVRVAFGVTAVAFAFLGATLSTMLLTVFGLHLGMEQVVSDLPLTELSQDPWYYVGLVALYATVVIPLAILALLGMSALRRQNQLRPAVGGLFLGTWILAASLTAAAASKFIPWAQEQTRLAAERNTVTRTLDLPAIDRLALRDGIRLTARQGTQAQLTLTGRQEDLDRLDLATTSGTLALGQLPRPEGKPCLFCIRTPVTAAMTLPSLRTAVLHDVSRLTVEPGFSGDFAADVHDAARLDAEGAFAAATFRLQDLGRASVRGTASTTVAEIRGQARLDAQALRAGTVEITAGEMGYAAVTPIETLHATSTDFGRIRAYGDPTIRQAHEAGHGRIEFTEPSAIGR